MVRKCPAERSRFLAGRLGTLAQEKLDGKAFHTKRARCARHSTSSHLSLVFVAAKVKLLAAGTVPYADMP